MADFMISFLISNLWITIMTAMLLAVQKIFRRCFTNRTKYHLWFLLLGFCMVPLLPLPAMQLPLLKPAAVFQGTAPNAAAARPEGAADWLRDFSITISKRSPLGMWKLRHTLRFIRSANLRFRCKMLPCAVFISAVLRKCTCKSRFLSTALRI